MTKRERAAIVAAIREIHNGDYHDGMTALCRAAGIATPLADILDGCKAVDLTEIAVKPNQTFRVKEPNAQS